MVDGLLLVFFILVGRDILHLDYDYFGLGGDERGRKEIDLFAEATALGWWTVSSFSWYLACEWIFLEWTRLDSIG